MFKDYKSNYCPQARMSNYVKLWLKTAQFSVSSLDGSQEQSTRGMARQGAAPGQCRSPAGTRDRHKGWTWDCRKEGKLGAKGRKGKIGRAMEMRNCGHHVGTPTTLAAGHKPG